MTPFLRQIYLKFRNSSTHTERTRAAIEQIENSVCFECSEIMPLIGETLKTLQGSTLRGIDGKPVVGHGGLLVIPHEYTWLEWLQQNDEPEAAKYGLPVGKKYRVGAMLWHDKENDRITIEITSQPGLEDLRCPVVMHSQIALLPDECCRVEAYTSMNENDSFMAEAAGRMGGAVVAMLLILNAPYGIDKDAQPIHKGHAKEARQHGVNLKAWHYVRLSKKPPPSEMVKGQGPAFHKAFHFVRSHLRHYQNGAKTMVKAHWRGDPRLGICPMPDYKIKP